MNIGLFAFGRAGCKITDEFRRVEKRTGHDVTDIVMVADTAVQQLDNLESITDEGNENEDWHVTYGQAMFNGKGSRADLEPAVDAVKTIEQDIINITTRTSTDIDAFVVIGSLAGGTGGSGAPFCASVLASKNRSVPVYGVGILPHRNEESKEPLRTVNAHRSIQAFQRETDSLILIDNDHIDVQVPGGDSDETRAEVFNDANETIAELLHTVFAADEHTTPPNAPGTIVDTETIKGTLATGGFATLSYTEETLPRHLHPGIQGVLFRILNALNPLQHAQNSDSGEDSDSVLSPVSLLPHVLQEEAALFPCNPASTARSLHFLRGPGEYMTSEEFIEAGEYLNENVTAEFRAVKGVPKHSREIGVVSVNAGIGVPERIETLQEEAEHVVDEVFDRTNAKNVNIFDDDSGIPPAFDPS